MAKVTPSHLFSAISGKLCKKDRDYIAYNKRTGQMYSALHHSYGVQPNSAEQQAVKTTFASKATFAGQWWRANKPADKDSKGTEAYQLVMKAYRSQTKIGNPYSFLRSLVTDDLKILLGTKDITGGITLPDGEDNTPTPPAQGTEGNPLE